MIKVGAEIESVCGKCGDVMHVVAAITHGQISKVVCKDCGAQHRHRAPEDSDAEVVAPAPAAAPKPKAATKSRAKKNVGAAPNEARVAAVMSRPVQPYRTADSYRLGDRVEHPTFGTGIVDEIVGPQKMQVFFPTGHKLMLHGAAALS